MVPPSLDFSILYCVMSPSPVSVGAVHSSLISDLLMAVALSPVGLPASLGAPILKTAEMPYMGWSVFLFATCVAAQGIVAGSSSPRSSEPGWVLSQGL